MTIEQNINKIRAAKEKCMEIIYPRKCVTCGKILFIRTYRQIEAKTSVDGLCTECKGKVKYVGEPLCMKCGKQIYTSEKEYCPDCARTNHTFDRGMAVFQYDDAIRESIFRFKYYNHRVYGEFYGTQMAERCGKEIKGWNPDVIIPVPIHRKRMKKRGYNQAELICDRLSEMVGLPIDKYVLRREKYTLPQKELGDVQRKKNVENAFKITGNMIKYKKVLLVDDIYTTGNTIDGCAIALKHAGVKKVYFIAICIGSGV